MRNVSRRRWLIETVLVALLIARPDTQSRVGQAELHAAAGKGDIETVAALLASGVDVNAENDHGLTALCTAADRYNVEMVRLLLERGANPNAKDLEFGRTPLWLASRPGSDPKAKQAAAEVVKLLVAKGAGTEGESLVALIRARHTDAVKTIVGRGGVDPSYLNLALDAARRAQQNELADVLIKAGAKAPGPLDSPRSPARLKLLMGIYRSRSGQVLTLLPSVNEDELILERAGPRASASGWASRLSSART